VNQGYPLGFQALDDATLLGARIDLLGDTIRVIAVGSGYTFSAAHQFVSDLGANTLGAAGTLTTKNLGAGVFSAATTTLSAFPVATAAALIIYKDTGSASTSPLICFIDTATGGLPFTGAGADIHIVWDPGAFRIFQF
jgi:hypothetical protein